MPRPKPDKAALLASLAPHVLEHGLGQASLRPMAAAIGTSDRMLIYHFGSKEALMAALLDHLARDMAAGLEAALPAPPPEAPRPTAPALIAQIMALLRGPAFRPYLRLWFEVVAGSGPHGPLPPGLGHTLLGIYFDWIARRHPQGQAGAAASLALIEGLLVMEALGASAMVDQVLAGLEG